MKIDMKRFLILFITLSLAFSACSGTQQEEIQPTPQPISAPTRTPAPTPKPAPNFTGDKFYHEETGITYNKKDYIVSSHGDIKYWFSSLWQDDVQPKGSLWFAARVFPDGNRDYFITETQKLKNNFARGENVYHFLEQEDRLEITCYDTDSYATVNFVSKTIDFTHVNYDIQHTENITDTIIAGKNGYTIFEKEQFADNNWKYPIYLLENSTGKTKFLADFRGMRDGNRSAGFFSNGEVYTIDFDGFKIFSTDMNQKGHYFKLGDKFPFGDNITADIDRRYLLAVRRDPVKKDFITIYFQHNTFDDYNSRFLNGNEDTGKLNATYKVALFDKEGNLTKEYDTKVYVNWNSFGVQPVTMKLIEDNVIQFYSTHKGVYYSDIITFDLTDGSTAVTETINSSPNGKFMLYYEDYKNGGREIYLRNQRTGENSFIATDYGYSGERGYTSAGFFENGNVYVQQYDGYTVYSKSGEKQWQLGGGNFNFGENPEKGIECRYLAAVPSSYLKYPQRAIYYEVPAGEKGKTINKYQLEYTYKIVTFDKDGNVANIYDTQLNAFLNGRVSFYGLSKDVAEIYVYDNDEMITHALINLKNGEYTLAYTKENTI